jgi:hypothetical protein
MTPAVSPPTPHPQPIIDLTGDADGASNTIYPTAGELLSELDETMPNLGFTRHEERLLNAGFGYVHQVVDMPDVRQSFDQLEIPVGIRQEIFERAARMSRRAGKSKDITKTEDDPPT